MVYSLYDATVVMAKGALTSLKRMVTEAETHSNAAHFFDACLIDDMKPLTFQVSYATFVSHVMAAKLSDEAEYGEPEDDLDTYEKMHDCIDRALQSLNEVDKETANRLGEIVTSYTLPNRTIEVPLKVIVSQVNMPNIYFHISMAYAILRKEGVHLGKRDWSRGFVSDYIQ